MKAAILFGLIVLSGTSVSQRDLSGRWVVIQDRDFSGNRGTPAECTFTQQRDVLSVRCSAAGHLTGQVKGSQVAWSADMTNIPPVLTDHVILTYSGEVSRSSDTITGTWALKSRRSGLDEYGTFEATRKSGAR
jgi:hypothetical protein